MKFQFKILKFTSWKTARISKIILCRNAGRGYCGAHFDGLSQLQESYIISSVRSVIIGMNILLFNHNCLLVCLTGIISKIRNLCINLNLTF